METGRTIPAGEMEADDEAAGRKYTCDVRDQYT
jgi:hypothetical protein